MNHFSTTTLSDTVLPEADDADVLEQGRPVEPAADEEYPRAESDATTVSGHRLVV